MGRAKLGPALDQSPKPYSAPCLELYQLQVSRALLRVELLCTSVAAWDCR